MWSWRIQSTSGAYSRTKKDPLLQSLENRITELNDPWEDDEEDDDGDIVVRRWF